MRSKERSEELFERTPVRRAVLLQILPSVLAQMIALVYNFADTYFVGLLNSPVQTAGVSVVYSPYMSIGIVSNLFGVGGAAALASALGKQDFDGAKRVSSVSVWFGAAGSVLYALVFYALLQPVMFLSGATDETYAVASGYALWALVIGGPINILSQIFANLIRAEGRPFWASFGLSMGGILNIILDPFFVLPQYLDFGAVGAGMATAVSNVAALGFYLGFVLIKRKDTYVLPRPSYLKYTKLYLGRILKVGLPSSLQVALTVVAVSAHVKFVSRYSTEAVAAFGVCKRLDQLPTYFAIGVSNGLLPLLSYNYARHNEDRRRRAFRFGAAIAAGFAFLCLVFYEIFPHALVSFFIADEKTVSYGAQFLRRMVVAMPFMAIGYPMIVQFQAMGKVKEALVGSVLRKGALDIPLLFLLDHISPLYGITWVQPIVDVTAVAVSTILYLLVCKKEKDALPPPSDAPAQEA
ncbi:MAG: MATE family efflux transporter [Clostridia bacterium]|nr:MATE family efflux transporter [Clostridia bacterium]